MYTILLYSCKKKNYDVKIMFIYQTKPDIYLIKQLINFSIEMFLTVLSFQGYESFPTHSNFIYVPFQC